jgi:acetate kinase
MTVLLLNAGSSSLKATLMRAAEGSVVAHGAADWASGKTSYQYVGRDEKHHAEVVPWTGHAAAVKRFLSDLRQAKPIALAADSSLRAVGHRVVHGGPFTSSVRITPSIRSQIMALAELAPLHNPPSLQSLAAAETELPGVPQVAVFDSAFHATLPPEAYTYPVPRQWTRDWGVRRFGFHGLSHAYCSRRAAEILDKSQRNLRLVICHLGHGCSATAVRNGRSIDTTMGYTPLEGLMMATRSGSIDPGIILRLQQHYELSADEVEEALNRNSGLLGVSGVSGDMRRVLAAAKEGNEQARLAMDVYTHRIRQAIGALTATLGGVDALVFTAGVGENSAEVRAAVCKGLDCMGLTIDAERNEHCKPDADIARGDSRGRILVIATREDITMWREVVDVLNQESSSNRP